MTASKRCATSFDFVSFSTSSFSLSCQRDRERGYSERDPSPRRKRAPSPLLIKGSKVGPSEGFNSHLKALGLRAHYWSEVRRPAPRKGSTAASGHSGSAPTTDQGFVGWPPKGSDSRLRARRARDDPGYVRYITFKWIFNTFLEAMGGKHPRTIITDQDMAMRPAIKEVFPETVHRNCFFHIKANATRKMEIALQEI
jgi:hypothetical protein